MCKQPCHQQEKPGPAATALGVGVSGGAEAAVHAARRLVSNLPAGHMVVKLDFSNAFNCVRRDLILDSIATNIPEIYRLVYSAFSCCLLYTSPSPRD